MSSYSGDGFSNRDILSFAKLIDKMLFHMMRVGGDFMPKTIMQRMVYKLSDDVDCASDDEDEGEGRKSKNLGERDDGAPTEEASVSGVEIRSARNLEPMLMAWIHLLESVVVCQCYGISVCSGPFSFVELVDLVEWSQPPSERHGKLGWVFTLLRTGPTSMFIFGGMGACLGGLGERFLRPGSIHSPLSSPSCPSTA